VIQAWFLFRAVFLLQKYLYAEKTGMRKQAIGRSWPNCDAPVKSRLKEALTSVFWRTKKALTISTGAPTYLKI
jgi:hypothetical protein